MPNMKNAKKKVIVNAKKTVLNNDVKSSMRSSVKDTVKEVLNNNQQDAQAKFLVATKRIDKACSKGLVHKNKAARVKSRLAKKVNEMSK